MDHNTQLILRAEKFGFRFR